MDTVFHLSEIDEKIFARIDGKSYKKNCPLPLSELRYLRLAHKNFRGETETGELICNVAIAEALTDIFKKLYAENYPIEKIRLIDEYDADDEFSMSDNNSSCFNFRYVSHTNRISLHGYGLAVDINPLYNPYIKTVDGKKIIAPENSAEFEDRTRNFPHKITEERSPMSIPISSVGVQDSTFGSHNRTLPFSRLKSISSVSRSLRSKRPVCSRALILAISPEEKSFP